MQKSELRKSAINKLNQLTQAEKETIEQTLLQSVIHTNAWKHAQKIGITVSQGMEWDTTNIIRKAWEEGKDVYAPKCYPKESRLVFYRLQSFDELETVFYNLLEPQPIPENKIDKHELDLVFVPGLLYNAKGYRIGFGGGYYDRFLKDYKGRTLSTTSSFLVKDDLPVESHDIPVQQIVTENETIEAKG